MKAILMLAAALMVCGGTADAAQWQIDPAKSRLGFVGKQGGSPFDGRFTRWSGNIDFDPANPGAGKAAIDIDMASAVTGDREKDGAIPESDWFDVKSFPRARFEAASFRAKGGNAFEAVGSLSIRGVKKEVVLPFTLEISGDAARAKGRLDLIRTDYGVGQGVWKSGDTVALEVAVTVDLVADRKP
ncbi:polyisoprenoid-binding protein [Paramagnetospirillum marisnigri]|uniref:Polyisoprenoid-binding protein n=1 Tax=Paramagnetospirillum marisnigri TaxID=1285242 RepID=A0A178MQE3_9PROT|nr:YceI family protein [Paramagnetospirillum marisnigri]OAN51100.1 polyisoprenoid-binding protein [Paramagnetospirillum marisnigri]